jgi:hypothetical protein
MKKGEIKGQNKCKIGKNKAKKAMMGVKKRHVVRGEKISFSEGGGDKFRFRTEIYTNVEAALPSMGCVA